MRYAHTDVSSPDFSHCRRESNADPHKPASETKDQRKIFTYGLTAVSTIPAMYLGKGIAKGYLSLFEANKKVLAMSSVEVDISGIAEGKALVTTWRGKPLFIRHRTAAEIDEMANVNMSDLRDPQVSHVWWCLCGYVLAMLSAKPVHL